MSDMQNTSDERGTAEIAGRLRRLPAVEHVLQHPSVRPLCDEFPRSEVTRAVQAVIERRRAAVQAGQTPGLEIGAMALDIRAALFGRAQPSLRRVINATGIVLHTGLGRAPLARAALDAILETAGGYCNLEIDLESGERGDRHDHVAELLRELTGAEDALVVNNNAGATMLTLRALAAGRGVVVSRGELVEIGGSYRLPDVMRAAGCRLVEVGTTNRTYARDYAAAMDADCAVLLRVHTSNYRIAGFSTAPRLTELVELAGGAAGGGDGQGSCGGDVGGKVALRRVLVVDDLGSGLLDHEIARQVAARSGFAAEWDEPSVRDSVSGGADVTLFSGDKLLGGPQAGIVVGRKDVLGRLKRDPMMRALRPDKMQLAALEATLRLYRDPRRLIDEVPTLALLSQPESMLRGRAEALAEACRSALPGAEIEVRADRSFAGGGTLPMLEFPTVVVSVRAAGVRSSEAAEHLRGADVPVMCRVSDEAVVLDCRTIRDEEVEEVARAVGELG